MNDGPEYDSRVLDFRLANVETSLHEMKTSTKEIGECLRELVVQSALAAENRAMMAKELSKIEALDVRLRRMESELPTLSAIKKILVTGFGVTFTIVFGYLFNRA